MSSNSTIVKFYRDGKEPIFTEPWEAHAFALAVKLHEQGVYSWTEWSETLAESIRKNNGAPYYENWLQALESLVLKKGIIENKELLAGINSLKADD